MIKSDHAESSNSDELVENFVSTTDSDFHLDEFHKYDQVGLPLISGRLAECSIRAGVTLTFSGTAQTTT
jgi:hypothetical protein